MKRFFLVLILTIVASFYLVAQDSIERVEPPFWWVGMQDTTLQLLVNGQNIGTYDVLINNDDVEVLQVTKVESKNYLFIDLAISRDCKPSDIELVFTKKGETDLTIGYSLKERKKEANLRAGFNTSDVMYLITPDRFANGDPSNDELPNLREGKNREAPFGRHGGDIQGIIDNLDYIDEMGFTAIWLNPVLENDMEKWSYHGYSTTDYYKVDPRFGTNEKYLELSRKAREKGIGLVMDIIVNHCGSFHWWMEDPPSKDWVNNISGPYQETSHRKSTLLDPYVAEIDRKVMVEGWFVPTMPDLNQRNALLSKYLIQNSIWWIEYADLAGIRQDTYSYPFREFMTDWTCAIMNEYPNFSIVGEEWVENTAIISYWQQGKQNQDGYSSCLGSLMDFPMTFNLHKGLTEEEGWSTGLRRMYEGLANDFLYADPTNLVIFPDNHDMSRIYTQVNEDFDLFKMAVGYMLTMRGTPQLYYGTEILMSNKGTDSHGVIRSDFPGGWEDDDKNGFTGEGLSDQEKEAKKFIQKLLKWRKKKTTIHHGKLKHFLPEDGTYVYFRYDDYGTVMIILNKNAETKMIPLARYKEMIRNNRVGHNVLTGELFDIGETLELPAKSISVIELKP